MKLRNEQHGSRVWVALAGVYGDNELAIVSLGDRLRYMEVTALRPDSTAFRNCDFSHNFELVKQWFHQTDEYPLPLARG